MTDAKPKRDKTKEAINKKLQPLTFDVWGLSKLLGVAVETIYDYQRKGMPSIPGVMRGQHGETSLFDGPTCVRWYSDNVGSMNLLEDDDSTIVELKRKKLAIDVAKAEVELAKLSENLVDVEFVLNSVAEEYTLLKQQLRAIPQRVTPVIIGEVSEAIIKKLISDEIDVVLNGLSQNILSREREVIDWADDAESVAEAAPEDDGFSVGGCEAADHGW